MWKGVRAVADLRGRGTRREPPVDARSHQYRPVVESGSTIRGFELDWTRG